MDQGESTQKASNPREGASIFSIIFFYFTAPILKKSRTRDLQEKDVYKVLPKFESEKLGTELETIWNRKLSAVAPLPDESVECPLTPYGTKGHKIDNSAEVSILYCLIRKFGLYYFGLGVMQLVVKSTVILLLPKAISRFVAYFAPGETSISKSQVYGYAFTVVAISMVNCIYNHNYQQLIMEFSLRVRTALCSLIYRKALKLNAEVSSEFSIGKVVTLITKDVQSIDAVMIFFNDIWVGVLHVGLVTYMIYTRIGASVFVGIGFFIIVIPFQSYCGRKFSLTRLVAAKCAEQRIQLVKEALNAIKIIKMYTWEGFFERLIGAARVKEIQKLKIIYYLKAVIVTLGGLTMKVAFFLLIITYTLVGKTVTAETVTFVSQSFNSLRSCITISIPMGINSLAEFYAAMKRFYQFLNAPEFVPLIHDRKLSIEPKVYLEKVSVMIHGQEVLKSVSLDVSSGGLVVVSGNIGSGKSCLLKTILKEYPISSGNMVVNGTISYAPEEPWVFPSTIRQNILFGQPYEEQRYQEVLRVCALTYDLNHLKNLDNTVVGDKGITLSKGQQARICLARAVYTDSDIYLLDDCLSAVDGHVNNHVFKECIKGFLQSKLVILISNNFSNIKQVPTGNVLFMENGRTLDLDQQRASLDKRITYFIDEDNRFYPEDSDDDNEPSEEDALLLHKEYTEPRRNLHYEENKQGGVLWKNYVTYYKYTGGIAVLLYMIIVFVLCQSALAYSEKLLSRWVDVEPMVANLSRTNRIDTKEYHDSLGARNLLVKLYCSMVLVGTILSLVRSFSNFYFCTRAGRKLHNVLVAGVLNARMTFFDHHFTGNIINRVSKDFHTIDESIPFVIYELFRNLCSVTATVFLIATVNYYFLIPCSCLFLVLFFIQRYYLPTGRSLRRLEAATRSPMIGYINASLEGLITVHACKEERILQREFDRHQDLFTSAYYMSQSCVRIFAFSLDMMCPLFLACIIMKFAIFSEGVKAGDVMLAVTQAMGLHGMLQWAIRQAAEMENTMTSVERVLEYADAEQEDKQASDSILKCPPKTRRSSQIPSPIAGDISYEDVSLTYEITGERVLKNISFRIKEKSKIGIVGRTGAGKTSIISALFRLYDYQGHIFIDGLDIESLPLDILRSNIGIIPQDPILFSGTIRSNIDPLNQYPDLTIWDALEKVQMKDSISSLDQPITDHGKNYSSGQRQLLCLARALVCKNKIVVLDEATANMDVETDRSLQMTMQHHFSDCTVLTIAHRLNSFQVADKILVIEDGRVVQFDTPSALLADKEGLFYKIVQDSGGITFL
ncbi:ATP-binding cassette sub-family C member 4-like [Euwallacea fornicatus]|uniref:ATP-binding cassette sub-family C member 4-like n=1 Tax=Euwallacea fornicatus TaxID=995702 RepID=UPI00338E7E54